MRRGAAHPRVEGGAESRAGPSKTTTNNNNNSNNNNNNNEYTNNHNNKCVYIYIYRLCYAFLHSSI